MVYVLIVFLLVVCFFAYHAIKYRNPYKLIMVFGKKAPVSQPWRLNWLSNMPVKDGLYFVIGLVCLELIIFVRKMSVSVNFLPVL